MKKLLFVAGLLLIIFAPAQQFIYAGDPGGAPGAGPGGTPGADPGGTPGGAPAGGESTYELPNFLGITDPNILINRIIRAILGVTGSAALIIFIYGGFLWLTSAGSDTKVQKGTNAMKWAAIGLVVIFSAYVLVSFILNSLETAAIK